MSIALSVRAVTDNPSNYWYKQFDRAQLARQDLRVSFLPAEVSNWKVEFNYSTTVGGQNFPPNLQFSRNSRKFSKSRIYIVVLMLWPYLWYYYQSSLLIYVFTNTQMIRNDIFISPSNGSATKSCRCVKGSSLYHIHSEILPW